MQRRLQLAHRIALPAQVIRAGVPVVEVRETLPDGADYLSWQRNTVGQLR
ncbi:hypothetical protein JHV675_45660 [Mycobacterium avium subsp. hominissuis]